MDRPWWWRRLTLLPPVERMLAREIQEAVNREVQPRAAAGRKIRELQRENDDLRTHNAKLLRSTDSLRKQIVASDTARRWQQVLYPNNPPGRPPKRTSSASGESDLFACLNCGSFLLLTTSILHFPDKGCKTCRDLPSVRPPARAVVEPSACWFEVELPVPGTPQERDQIAAKLIVDLMASSPADFVANVSAEKMADVSRSMLKRKEPTETSVLDVIATGLEKVPGTVKSGIVWIATQLFGVPGIIAHVLGFVVSDVVTDPLHLKNVARAIRLVDSMACAMEGDLSKCASFQHLMIDLGQTAMADRIKEPLNNAVAQIEIGAVVEPDRKKVDLRDLSEPDKARPTATPTPPTLSSGQDLNRHSDPGDGISDFGPPAPGPF